MLSEEDRKYVMMHTEISIHVACGRKEYREERKSEREDAQQQQQKQ